MPNPPAAGERIARPLRWLERLLLIAGAAALVWCAVLVSDRVIAQRNAQSALEIAQAVDELTSSAVEEGAIEVPPPSPVATGAVLASLSIPRVDLSAMVLHGSDARTLQQGPGHLEHTAVPGEGGNIVIAGHRDSFFRPLRDIRVGDDIFLETRRGHFHYRVSSLRVVGAREVSVLAPTSEETLTLITCYPFWVLGHAPDRFIVHAARVDYRRPAPLAARTLAARDWLDTPALHTPALDTPLDPPAPRSATPRPIAALLDDEGLVRQTVRRYLVAQGVQPGACTVSVTEDRANADCESAAPANVDREQPRRLFALERSDSTWAIKSIVLTEAQTSPAEEPPPQEAP